MLEPSEVSLNANCATATPRAIILYIKMGPFCGKKVCDIFFFQSFVNSEVEIYVWIPCVTAQQKQLFKEHLSL